jgi:hypothetical protein
MQAGRVSTRLQRDMNPRDAEISFQCLPLDCVRVTEMIGGASIRHEDVQRDSDIVTELEKRYIFFAKQAEIARRRLKLGHSCMFNVYFREP